MQQRVSSSAEGYAGFHVLDSNVRTSSCSHFFLFLREHAAQAHACALALSQSLWEFLHALEGISRWLPFSFPLVGNMFFKLALGSFEGNPDIVGKRARGQLKKKKKSMLYSQFVINLQYKQRKINYSDPATDIEVLWLGVIPKLGLPPDLLLFTSRELFLFGKRVA